MLFTGFFYKSEKNMFLCFLFANLYFNIYGLAVYNNEFILSNPCVDSENHWD